MKTDNSRYNGYTLELGLGCGRYSGRLTTSIAEQVLLNVAARLSIVQEKHKNLLYERGKRGYA